MKDEEEQEEAVSVDAVSLREALRDVTDPEAGVNIVDMGLVYDVTFDPASRRASVTMTLTTPFCPAGNAMLDGVHRRLMRVPGVEDANVEVVFDPPWSPERISDAGRAILGW